MRVKDFSITVTLIAAALIAVLGSQVLGAQSDPDSEPITREELRRQPLGTADGKQAMMLRVQLAPGAAFADGPTVTYPAEELVYIVEGSARLQREGEEIQLEAGDSFYNAAEEPHSLANASSSEPLTVVAVWIGDEADF